MIVTDCQGDGLRGDGRVELVIWITAGCGCDFDVVTVTLTYNATKHNKERRVLLCVVGRYLSNHALQ